jgi:hypothetical protein
VVICGGFKERAPEYLPFSPARTPPAGSAPKSKTGISSFIRWLRREWVLKGGLTAAGRWVVLTQAGCLSFGGEGQAPPVASGSILQGDIVTRATTGGKDSLHHSEGLVGAKGNETAVIMQFPADTEGKSSAVFC